MLLMKVKAKEDEPVFVNVYPIAAEYGRNGGIAKLKREIDRLEKERPVFMSICYRKILLHLLLAILIRKKR